LAGLNRCVLIGNLTEDPELRYTQSGTARTRFSIAINRRYKGRDGNLQEDTTFVPIVVWGPQAENCANYLSKGRQICVDGRLRIDSFTNEEGERRKVAEVVAESVQFLGGGRRDDDSGGGGGGNSNQQQQNQSSSSSDSSGDEEVPF